MTGHVFLDPADVERLRQEMVLQGVMLPRLEPGVHVTATEVDAALEAAADEVVRGLSAIAVSVLTFFPVWRAWLKRRSSRGPIFPRS